ncbi:Uncharacterised protein [Mycobacteroides abscessus subsp. abscessus]|uniref:Uncharacterized protein n=2 Tax=Gordoniaceae TaxID=85026 RepID=A0ABR5IF09_9ACTN|nr:hypothetical protein ABW18_08050 [Gordonia jacobaea]SKX77922.1 Uncharacterised protein [Mycobacteroides abscessus subsp. abscessus]
MVGTLVGAAAVIGTAVGAANAEAKVAEGRYNFCVKTQYGSSVDERCNEYRVVGNQLIGPANQPLQLIDTPNGAVAVIPPASGLVITKNANGYKIVNTILGIPVATSQLTPLG